MKVFLLVNEWSIDHEQDTNVEVYETLSKARECMVNDAECWKSEDSFNNQTQEDDDNHVLIYEEGDYSRNHISWLIVEKEVERDNEIDNNNYPVSSVSTDDILGINKFVNLHLTDQNMLDIAREMHEYLLETDAYWDALYHAVDKVMFNK